MALPERKQDVTDARLAGLSLPAGGAWAAKAREAALARVEAMGLPTARDEYWKYTKPETLVSPDVAPADTHEDDASAIFGSLDRLKVVFVDGVFAPELSDPLEGEGLEIQRLAEAQESDIHWAADLYGALEANGQNPVPRTLAALNTAFASDGVVIRATGVVARPVNLIYIHRDAQSDAMLHHVIRVEAGAELTVLENGPAAARFNKVLEMDVADGATLHHVRTQGRDHHRRAVTGNFARLGAASVFKSFTLTMNGVLTRNECVIEITGDEATAHVAGACVGDGSDFHHDDTVFITHDAVDCESRQVFKKVLRNGATGVFQGKILVKEGAQKTDGYQISQGLLLDDDSQFLAKPELEIYADDVACSHGSTVGAIDDDQLFYLTARGIPSSDAHDLLTLAFLGEALDEIDDDAIAEILRDTLSGWLARRRA